MNLVTVERDIWTAGDFGKKLMRTTTSGYTFRLYFSKVVKDLFDSHKFLFHI